ncbi:MAG: YitT family protein [Erysipelotrichaceae bacterium]|nr:YitT family protein [Erysipelotrichaceae bacterium]
MKSKAIDILVILFGNFLLAVSVAFFVLPHNILSGGVAGIAVICNALFGFAENVVIDISVVATFLLGAVVLGREFTMKTALSSLVYPIFMELLLKIEVNMEMDMMLACVFGGAIAGAGIGLVFRHNASTGGTDVPCLIIAKYTGLNISSVVMAVDALVCMAGLIAYGIEDVFFGIVYIFMSSYAINRVMVPKTDEAVALYIISSKCQEICEFIHIDLYRGTTLLNAVGGYTNEARQVILTVVSKSQYGVLTHFLEKTDPYAFVIVSDAKEIKGEGFTYEYRV